MHFARLLLAVILSGACVGEVWAQAVPALDANAQELARCEQLVSGDPKQAVHIATRVLAQPEVPARSVVRAELCRGHASVIMADPAQAARSAQRIKEVLDTSAFSEAEAGSAQLGLGSLYNVLGDHVLALQAFNAALDSAEGSYKEVAALSQIALLYANALGDPAVALGYFERALKIEPENLGSSPERGLLYYNYGYALFQLKRYADALNAFALAREQLERRPESAVLLGRIDSHMGEAACLAGQCDQGLMLLNRALAQQQEHADRHGETVTLTRLAGRDLAAGNIPRALQRAEHALALAEQGRFGEETRQALLVLADIQVARGQGALALSLVKRAHAMELADVRQRDSQRVTLARTQVAKAAELRDGERVANVVGIKVMRNLAVGVSLLLLTGGAMAFSWLYRRYRAASALAYTDDATQLPNRREALKVLDAIPGQGMHALMLLEIEGMADVGGRHGPSGLEAVMQSVAGVIRAQADADDFICRWSDAQLLLIRLNTNSEPMQALAGHLLRAVAAQQIALPDGVPLRPVLHACISGLPLHLQSGAGDVMGSLQVAMRGLDIVRRREGGGWISIWTKPDTAAPSLQVMLESLSSTDSCPWAEVAVSRAGFVR